MSNYSVLSETKDILIDYLPWIQAPGIYQLLPWRGREGPGYPYFVDRTEDVGPAESADTTECPPPGCSSSDDCMKFFDSLNRALGGIDVGTRFTLDPQRPLFQSSWAYNVLTAIANINQQLSNQYQALQSAAIESALATFNIADYWPKLG